MPVVAVQKKNPVRSTASARPSEVGLTVTNIVEELPMLASTRLYFGLALGRGLLNVEELTGIVSGDPVAVLWLFRLIGQRGDLQWDTPRRLEECVASLEREEFLDAFIRHGGTGTGEQPGYIAFTHHAVQIAFGCRRLAYVLDLEEESAFLLGLLHEMGSLPAALGRLGVGFLRPEPACVIAERIARLYHLPRSLSEALNEVHRGDPRSVWLALVRAAHDLTANHDSVR